MYAQACKSEKQLQLANLASLDSLWANAIGGLSCRLWTKRHDKPSQAEAPEGFSVSRGQR